VGRPLAMGDTVSDLNHGPVRAGTPGRQKAGQADLWRVTSRDGGSDFSVMSPGTLFFLAAGGPGLIPGYAGRCSARGPRRHPPDPAD